VNGAHVWWPDAGDWVVRRGVVADDLRAISYLHHISAGCSVAESDSGHGYRRGSGMRVSEWDERSVGG